MRSDTNIQVPRPARVLPVVGMNSHFLPSRRNIKHLSFRHSSRQVVLSHLPHRRRQTSRDTIILARTWPNMPLDRPNEIAWGSATMAYDTISGLRGSSYCHCICQPAEDKAASCQDYAVWNRHHHLNRFGEEPVAATTLTLQILKVRY